MGSLATEMGWADDRSLLLAREVGKRREGTGVGIGDFYVCRELYMYS